MCNKFTVAVKEDPKKVITVNPKDTEKKEGKFSFGFGKNKKQKAAAAEAKAAKVAAEKEQKRLEKEEKKKKKEEKKKKHVVIHLSDDEKEKEIIKDEDDDPQYALHKKIIQMTSNIQEKGAGHTAFNDYMEEFKTKSVQLQSDRTEIIKRESANFMVTLQQSKDDSAKKEVVYGRGVEYIAQKLYLMEKVEQPLIEDTDRLMDGQE
jgi:hypothetical protein